MIGKASSSDIVLLNSFSSSGEREARRKSIASLSLRLVMFVVELKLCFDESFRALQRQSGVMSDDCDHLCLLSQDQVRKRWSLDPYFLRWSNTFLSKTTRSLSISSGNFESRSTTRVRFLCGANGGISELMGSLGSCFCIRMQS